MSKTQTIVFFNSLPGKELLDWFATHPTRESPSKQTDQSKRRIVRLFEKTGQYGSTRTQHERYTYDESTTCDGSA
jgi:hypothetical protein